LDEKTLDESVHTISMQVKYLSQTIDDFREFYKKDDGNEFPINESITNAISLVEATFKNNFISLELNFEKTNPKIVGSKGRLTQVFINILNNAKDILTQNLHQERVVSITTLLQDKTVRIFIFDSGGGVDRKIINNIFDPYFTTKESKNGTGLGLYMSKQIIEKQLHGKIYVKNSKFSHDEREYFGACFIIDLPIK